MREALLRRKGSVLLHLHDIAGGGVDLDLILRVFIADLDLVNASSVVIVLAELHYVFFRGSGHLGKGDGLCVRFRNVNLRICMAIMKPV